METPCSSPLTHFWPSIFDAKILIMRASEPDDGVVRGIDVESCREFGQALEKMSLGNQYVFRGQACDLWELRPGLFRGEGLLLQDAWRLTKQHLQCFKGRVQNIKERIPFLKDIDLRISREEWWILGQHYGLQTPILDWTQSPFIAAFFAFFQNRPEKEDPCFDAWEEEPWRCVWAARRCSINRKFSEYKDPTKAFRSIHFFDPKICFQRIRDQRGLFSLGPTLDCIEHTVKANFKGCETPILIQIRIRHTESFVKGPENKNCLTDAIMLEASKNEDLEETARYCNNLLKSALAEGTVPLPANA